MVIVNEVNLKQMNFLVDIFHVKLTCFSSVLLTCPSGFDAQTNRIGRLGANSDAMKPGFSWVWCLPLADMVETCEGVLVVGWWPLKGREPEILHVLQCLG